MISAKKKDHSSIVPAPNDVLFGRGHKTYKHAGNQRYRYVIQSLKPEHDAAPKSLRAVYGKQVVNYIQNLQPPGRFLKRQAGKEKDAGAWIEVDTKLAVERARQALRDKKLPPLLPENLNPRHGKNLLASPVEWGSKVDFNVFCLATSNVILPPTSSPPPPPKDGSSATSSIAAASTTTTRTTGGGDTTSSLDLLLVNEESNQKMVRKDRHE